MTSHSIVPESARNISFVGHTDLGQRGHSDQVMVERGFAYIGHSKTRGVSVADVRDPARPKPIGLLPHHAHSWALHLQTGDGLLLVAEALDFKSVMDESAYHAKKLGGVQTQRFGTNGIDFSGGMRVYDIASPAEPREIGFMAVQGIGIHRIWYTGGRWAYASALVEGFLDYILLIIDLANPAKPVEAGRWWLPGMWAAGGETQPLAGRTGLHHAIISGDMAYGAWRDGGLTILDVADKTKPKLVKHLNWSPPFAGGTHTALPLHDRGLLVVADEATANADAEPAKPIWVLDIRVPENPVSIATFPVPADMDYAAKGGHFGPHNLHENRPGSFQSSTTIFATYQNAGVRVFDISNPFRPQETGWFVPPTPTRWMEPLRGRAKALHTADIFVDPQGLIYATDYDAGLYILQWDGH